MATINITIIHPTNNSEIELKMPDDTLLWDIFWELRKDNFISPNSLYQGVFFTIVDSIHSYRELSLFCTIAENDIPDNGKIQMIVGDVISEIPRVKMVCDQLKEAMSSVTGEFPELDTSLISVFEQCWRLNNYISLYAKQLEAGILSAALATAQGFLMRQNAGVL